MSWTQAALLTKVREAVLDTTVPYLWTDVVLYQCIEDGITTHSFLFPRPTTLFYDVVANDQQWTVGVVTTAAAILGHVTVPTPTSAADLISVQGVELPVGRPLPQDPWSTSNPAGSASSRYRQGFRWRGNILTVRNPASGTEVGLNKLRVDILQTYNIPDDTAGVAWNGPNHDVSLVVLLAKRAAYEALAEWQVRVQGDTAATIATGNINIHIDVPPILTALEVVIARAIAARQSRNLRSRALDI